MKGTPGHCQDGIPFTYLGAKVYCPVCRTVGSIVPSGPRHHHAFHQNQQVALEGDLCRCRCRPLPVLMASQDLAHHSFDPQELAKMGFTRDGTPCHMEDPEGSCDEKILALDPQGRPLPYIRYYLETSSGRVHRGWTDQLGYCARVHTANPREIRIWFGLAADMKIAGRRS